MKINYIKLEKLKLFFLIILSIFILYFIHCYCKKCVKNYNEKCRFCSREIIFYGLNIASREETLDEIINNKKSLARFGDGEFNLIFGWNNGFQQANKTLGNRLMNVLNSNLKNLLIGIYVPYRQSDMKYLTNSGIKYWERWFSMVKFKLAKILNKRKKYYSAIISRFYSLYKDKKKFDVLKYINKLKKIWNNRDLLIIEGYFSRNGVGNDLFNNAKSIKRIICPPKNAFLVYDKIITQIRKFEINKNILILVSLGQTASVLSYDLSKLGFQVIDIGHTDVEYEFYLRKYYKIKKIPYKYVNEAKNGDKNISNVTDINYYKQIFCKFPNLILCFLFFKLNNILEGENVISPR